MLSADIVEAMNRPGDKAICLPGWTYSSPVFLNEEYARIFRRSWVNIGYGYQVAEPGSMMPVTIAGQPLLMVRDLQGQLRVFHNVCRHRGALLVGDADRKTGRAIVCPYHAWAYGLDGRCMTAPCFHRNERRNLRPTREDDLDLIEVRTRVWIDTVFVDLSGEAPPLEDTIGPLESRWHTAEIGPLNHVTTWEGTIAANWKLVIENFLDTYHSAFVHSQLGPITPHIAHERVRLSPDIIGQRSVDAAITKPRSGPIPIIAPLEKALGADDETYWMYPNTLIFAQRSFLSMRTILPIDPSTTRELNAIYVSPEVTPEKFSAERQRMKEAIQLVNVQDVGILERLQATRSSIAADRGRFAPEWDFMSHQFQTRIAELLR
jgi:phenylpropionate dioxygenase-like ring-hydroxylating dioxygenase large terminal subunit